MKSHLLLFSLLYSTSFLFGQMEVGSVWKLTGNSATLLEQNNIDSTKIHFLASDVFLISYENNGNPYTETSMWTEPTTGSIDFTYDPSGFFFGNNCPTENTTFNYSVQNNSFTMTGVGGTCSIAQAVLNNSVWVRQSQLSLDEIDQNNFWIYPNPTSETVFLSSTFAIDLNQVKIYNLLGQELNFASTPVQANQLEINVSGFPKGWYIVDLKGEYKARFEVK